MTAGQRSPYPLLADEDSALLAASHNATPYYADDLVTLHHGDCLDVMRAMSDASVDAIVTDPPYGLGFMGREWDDLPPGLPWAQECLRVLKPGGHLLAFGGTRTWHRLAVAIEDAGFEMRDSIAWLYGSGFPKSLDVSKAIDKAAGAERKVLGPSARHGGGGNVAVPDLNRFAQAGDFITAPSTDAAKTWQGWGTALKPAFEPVVVARKPLVGTVAANVLAHGTGALNIDACRSEPTTSITDRQRAGEPSASRRYTQAGGTDFAALPGPRGGDARGRWPANVALDASQAAVLDEQSGNRPSKAGGSSPTTGFWGNAAGCEGVRRVDDGGASRFFYVAKAPQDERPRDGDLAHPTVKPLDLMRWLVRLVTPPRGIVLEPFAGSGTTVEACVIEGFSCIAIEREVTYLPLILARLSKPIQPDIFGGAA